MTERSSGQRRSRARALSSKGLTRISPSRAAGVALSVGLLCLLAATAKVKADDAANPPPAAAQVSPQEMEVLRKLLGVPGTAPAARREEPAAAPAVEAAPAAQPEPEPVVAEPAPAERQSGKSKPAARPAAKKAPARPVQKKSQPAPVEAAKPEAPKAAAEAQATETKTETPKAAVVSVALPPPGTVVSSANMAQYKDLLGPSIQWSIERGATLPVIESRPIGLEPFRAKATERYSPQVQLAPDRRSLVNYVAGIPFPTVTEDDPAAAAKMMFNMEARVAWDSLDIRDFTCATGSLDKNAGFVAQRNYLTDHFRRLFYVSRAFIDPKPVWKTPEGVRYREMLYPVREPFDLKGAGFTYIRYLDPNRQDDSWLYFPQTRRIRRLSTAQRSEGVFGQDVDLDSYGGYSGNPAWMTWTLLGKKKILASMHSDNKVPLDMQASPANFFPDGKWEARDTYIILGVSQLGGYNFGRRIIYLDADSWIIPYTEIYDLKGGLWRSLIHAWNVTKKARPNATKAIYDYEVIQIPVLSLVDMQLEHATYCQLPGVPNEDGWYYNFGPEEGVTEEVFSVSNMIETAR